MLCCGVLLGKAPRCRDGSDRPGPPRAYGCGPEPSSTGPRPSHSPRLPLEGHQARRAGRASEGKEGTGAKRGALIDITAKGPLEVLRPSAEKMTRRISPFFSLILKTFFSVGLIYPILLSLPLLPYFLFVFSFFLLFVCLVSVSCVCETLCCGSRTFMMLSSTIRDA